MHMKAFRTAVMLAMIVGLAGAAGAQDQAPRGERGGRQGQGGGGRGRGFFLPPLMMQTDAYEDGGIVPAKYASGNNGPSVLPAFKISNAPAGTVAYAVIYHDMDVSLMNGTGDVLHMMAWNIPASANGWQEGSLPAGSVMGKNLRGQNAYMGPAAPAGPRYHHYVWELYALNANLDLNADTATRDDLLKALQGKVVAKAAYVGRYRSGEAPAPPAGR